MSSSIPNSVIGAVASVIAAHYYCSHSKLDTVLMESMALGEAPAGNCETKCTAWLKRCNEAAGVDSLDVLGRVIKPLSIVDGVGAYRTHIGSAHGLGVSPPPIQVPEARLAVNASTRLSSLLWERGMQKTIPN